MSECKNWKFYALIATGVLTPLVGLSQPIFASDGNAVNNYIEERVKSGAFGKTNETNKINGVFPRYAYRNGVGKPEGFIVHESANDGDRGLGPDAAMAAEENYMINHWDNAFTHGWVSNNAIDTIASTDYLAWGAAYSGNQRYIQYEQVRLNGKDEWAKETYNMALIAAMKLKQYNLTPQLGNTLFSHAMISTMWHETNHTDPNGYWSSQAGNYFGTSYTMDNFAWLVGYLTDIYGKDKITSTKNVEYTAKINSAGSGDAVYLDAPYNVAGANRGVSLGDKNGQSILVKKEVTLSNGQVWYQIDFEGKTGFVFSGVVSNHQGITAINQNFVIDQSNSTDYFFTNGGYQFVGSKWGDSLKPYNKRHFVATKKMVAANGVVWYGGYLGSKYVWIAASVLKADTSVFKNDEYVASITGKNDNVYFVNPGEFTNSTVATNTNSLINKQVWVRGEYTISSDGVVWAKIYLNGKDAWIKTNSLTKVGTVQNTSLKVALNLAHKDDSYFTYEPYQFNSETWGNKISEAGWNGTILNVQKIMVDRNGITWYGGNKEGKFIWVAKSATTQATYTNTKYTAAFKNGVSDYVYYDRPWELAGVRAMSVKSLAGKNAVITQETRMDDGVTWGKFTINGRTAWVNLAAITKASNADSNQKFDVMLNPNKSNESYFGGDPYRFVNEKWGKKFNEADYTSKMMTVSDTMTDSYGVVWYGGKVSNTNQFIWVAKTATKPAADIQTNVSYVATFKANKPDGAFYDKPWEYGTAKAFDVKSILGRQLLVSMEWRTTDGVTWSKVSYNGRTIWINKAALSTNGSVQNVSNLKVTMNPGKTGESFFTDEPYQFLNEKWGTTFNAAGYTGKELSVSKVMITTTNVKWYGGTVDGKFIWVAASATNLK